MKPKSFLPFAIVALICLVVYLGCSGDKGGTDPPKTYALTINITGQGSVAKSPDNSKYTSGTSVELTADPDSGYAFENWSGDLEGTANPDTIEMTEDRVVTATFAEVPPITLIGTIALAEGGDLVSPIAFLDSSHGSRIVIFRNAGWMADSATGEFIIQFDPEDIDSFEAIVTGFDDINKNQAVDTNEPIGWWDVDGDSNWTQDDGTGDPDDYVTLRPGDTITGAEVLLYPTSSGSPAARKQPSGIIRLR
jgi:hypothetical protein